MIFPLKQNTLWIFIIWSMYVLLDTEISNPVRKYLLFSFLIILSYMVLFTAYQLYYFQSQIIVYAKSTVKCSQWPYIGPILQKRIIFSPNMYN